MRPLNEIMSGVRNERPTEPELELAYTVPYNWGTLQVSQEANQQLGITPLSEGVVRGDETNSAATPTVTRARVDIRLMSEAEYIERHELDEPDSSGRGEVYLAANRSVKNDLQIDLAMMDDREEIKDNIQRIQTEFFEAIAEQIPEPIEMHEPEPEELEQFSSDTITHSLVAAVEKELQRGLLDATERQLHRRSTRYAGTLALVGSAGTVAALSVATEASPDNVVPGLLGGVTLYSLFALFDTIRKTDKDYFSKARRMEGDASLAAELLADDIHNTYCIHTFDAQAEAMFESSTDHPSEED